MSNDAFRDALARSINDATYYRYLDMVDDILASPDMETIRKALRTAAEDIVDSYTNWSTVPEAMSLFLKLPESVIEWVLGGSS